MGREADHSPPSSAKFMNAWSYITTPQYAFMAWCSVKAQDKLYFYLLLLHWWHNRKKQQNALKSNYYKILSQNHFHIYCRPVKTRSQNCLQEDSFQLCKIRGCIKSFRTGRLGREPQIVQLSATRCSCIAIL
jgi:predicted glycosyltransferase involved in capsule biosynthesis